jgi:hypothetical protein
VYSYVHISPAVWRHSAKCCVTSCPEFHSSERWRQRSSNMQWYCLIGQYPNLLNWSNFSQCCNHVHHYHTLIWLAVTFKPYSTFDFVSYVRQYRIKPSFTVQERRGEEGCKAKKYSNWHASTFIYLELKPVSRQTLGACVMCTVSVTQLYTTLTFTL